MTNDMSPGGLPGRFDITEFFAGRTRAHGVFEDRFGRPRRRFMIDIDGRWDGDTFVLDEHFHYEDGETERRTWRIEPKASDRFVATTPDCVGTAQGENSANFWHMTYRFRLRLGRRAITVAFDDRVYRAGPTTAVNRATMRKFGIRLGDALIIYEKNQSAVAAHTDRVSVSA